MTTLEEKLGYEFRDPALLENALTHSPVPMRAGDASRAMSVWNFWVTRSWAWWWPTTCTATTRICLRES